MRASFQVNLNTMLYKGRDTAIDRKVAKRPGALLLLNR